MVESIKISILSLKDHKTIKNVFEKLLYVPDIRLKPKIIETISDYIVREMNNKNKKLKVFALFQSREPIGSITCQIDFAFKSYGGSSGTFGWLMTESFEVCKRLLTRAERFFMRNGISTIRGPINVPKGIGGVGLQLSGFEQQMLYGAPFNSSKSKIKEFLLELGYFEDANYFCIKIIQNLWKKGIKTDRNIRLGHLTIEEIINRKEEILNLARDSFHGFLPDSSPFDERFEEIMDQIKQVPFRKNQNSNSKLKFLEHHSVDPLLLDILNSQNDNDVTIWIHFVFLKETDEIIGLATTLPDLYELWLGERISRVNVDTAMIKRKYNGRGILSSLNNLVQLIGTIYGINHYEGVGLWSNNERAIKTILPHSKIVRKNVVFKKNLIYPN